MSVAQLLRLPAGFTAVSNILAAQLIATGGGLMWPETPLLVLASLALYHAGMVLNDCFDYAEDLDERPHRPLPAGRIPRRAAWAAGWGLLAMGLGLAALAGWLPALAAAVIALLVVAYDGLLKRGPLGPAAMAGCRYGNWLLGFSVTGIGVEGFVLALPIGLYIAGVTTLGRQETGTPGRLGIAVSGLALAAAAATLLMLWAADLLPSPWLPPLAVAAGAYLGWRYVRLLRGAEASDVRQLMGLLILGVIPLDALLVLGAGLPVPALGVLLLLAPARVLARFSYVT